LPFQEELFSYWPWNFRPAHRPRHPVSVGAGHRQRAGAQRLQGSAEQDGRSPTRSLHGRLGSSRWDGQPSCPERQPAGEPNRLSNRVFDGQVL